MLLQPKFFLIVGAPLILLTYHTSTSGFINESMEKSTNYLTESLTVVPSDVDKGGKGPHGTSCQAFTFRERAF